MKDKLWLCVDKDGTEKATNNKPIRSTPITHVLGIPLNITKNSKKKWTNGWGVGRHKSTLNFEGAILPKGTIEKLIGKKLTWLDEPKEYTNG